MSPILKRDVGETIRQARRLATIATGGKADDDAYEQHNQHDHRIHDGEREEGYKGKWTVVDEMTENGSYGSGADRRQGIGVINGDKGWQDHTVGSRVSVEQETRLNSGRGEERWSCDDDPLEERGRMLSFEMADNALQRGHIEGLEYEEAENGSSARHGQLLDLRNLLLEVSTMNK